jgi:integrase
MKRKPNDKNLTLREAFEKHYPKDEMVKRSVEKMRYDLLRWERLTKNGAMPISKITDEVLEEFRKLLLAKYTPASVNGTRAILRAIFRRLGPPVTGNPTGLGILPRVPYMKPSKVIRGLPRRVDQEDLSRWYIACEQIQSPKWGGPAAFWWQSWLVLAYFTGLRKSDVFAIRFADIDFDKGTLLFTARKTSKPMRLPLHPCVIEHVRRIEQPKREHVFESSIKASGSFNKRWEWICRKAGIAEPFTPHDIRRTASSEIERAKPGMASVLLQHSINDTTHVSYLNQMEELAEAIEKVRVPLAFKHGPKQAERQLARQREAAQSMMKAAQFSPPSFPDPAEWQFHNVGFVFRGHSVHMGGGALRILEAIAHSPLHQCTLEELEKAVWPDGHRGRSTKPPAGSEAAPRAKRPGRLATAFRDETPERLREIRNAAGRISDCISTIRERLRHALLLPDSFNPVPCVARGNGGVWTLYIPGEAGRGAA